MVCFCGGNLDFFGNIAYIFEKIAACCALSAVISCIVVTTMISIGLGVGLGYNYCYVERKSNESETVHNILNENSAGLRQSDLDEAFATDDGFTQSPVTFRTGKFVATRKGDRSTEFAVILNKYRNNSTESNMDDAKAKHKVNLTSSQSRDPQNNHNREPPTREPNTLMSVPLVSQINITSLLAKILARNESITVEFLRI